MTELMNLAIAISALLSPSSQIPACELIDLQSAQTLLGEGASEVGGGANPSLCQYMGELGQSLLSVQVTEAEQYEILGVPEPHTDVAIGDRARYGTDEAGDVTLQFVKGELHVFIKFAPNPERPAPLESLERVARTAAAGIP